MSLPSGSAPGPAPDHHRAAPVDGARTFPFTVIDQAVHLLDTPSEPWGVHLELGVAGRLDPTLQRVAVDGAMAAHPMARARRLPARRTDRSWMWEIAPAADIDPVRVVDCPDDTTLTEARAALYSRQVPIVEAPPFRVVLARRPDGDRMLLATNHAAIDGLGSVRLAQSIANHYAGRPDPATAVDVTEARDVARHTATRDSTERALRYRMLAGMAADLVRRPATIVPEGATRRPGYGFHLTVLSAERTSRVIDHPGHTVNELLLAALTQAVAGWNREHGKAPGRIGLLVPVNLRP